MKKILVIEDDIPLCWLLEKILAPNYEVVIMNNGLDAWCWLTDNNSPELIISDLKMPGLDGTELLENLRNSGLFRDIPVIILSGYEDAQKRKECLELGASNYLVKPFEPRLLIEIVDSVIAGQNERVHV